MKNYTYVNEPDVRYDGKSLVAACLEKASKLTTNDLMKVLFSDGDKIADQDFSPLIEDLNRYGSIDDMKPCTSRIQKAKAKAFAELVSRLKVSGGPIIHSPDEVYQEIRHYANEEQEQFIVVCLDGAHRMVKTFVATRGIVNRTIIHPREVFSIPIQLRCTAVILAHNHPSGVLDPSADDISTTTRLVESGALLGINVLDSMIIGRTGYLSMKTEGIM